MPLPCERRVSTDFTFLAWLVDCGLFVRMWIRGGTRRHVWTSWGSWVLLVLSGPQQYSYEHENAALTVIDGT